MIEKLRKVSTYGALALVAVATMCTQAMAQVTLPTTGVDVEGHIDAVIADLGTVALAAVGGYFAFLLIKKALSWGRTAIR